MSSSFVFILMTLNKEMLAGYFLFPSAMVVYHRYPDVFRGIEVD